MLKSKIDKRKEVRSLGTELKAHDLDLDSDCGIAKRRVAALSFGAGFMFTWRARGHRRMPDVLTFIHNGVEHPVVDECFYASASDP